MRTSKPLVTMHRGLGRISSGILFCLTVASAQYRDGAVLPTDPDAYDSVDIIERDVVVIGGGSSGTYTAIRLQDYNKTVAVIEKKDTLGGHAETYTDPSTGFTIDLGVVVFAQSQTVTDYFSRLNVTLITTPSVEVNNTYVDFSTGKIVDYHLPSTEAVETALNTYITRLQEYPTLQGSFNMTYPTDPDLLLPFGEFVAKYQLGDLVPQVFSYNQGYAPLLDISMLYIFKYLNLAELNSFKEGFLTTTNQNAGELYEKAAAYLGPDNVLLSSTVVSIDRSADGAALIVVATPTGPKLIRAKKIVSTIPPLIQNLRGYDLSDEEKGLFGQFHANGYYTALLNNTGINATLNAVAPSRPYGIPELPGPYSIRVDKGLAHIYYGSPKVMTEEHVKADMIANLRRFQEANGIQTDGEPEWVAFANHAPFNLMVSNEAISGGFYEKLFALQGKRNTFYNGAAWHTQDSSVLWKFTDDYILPILLASLQQ